MILSVSDSVSWPVLRLVVCIFIGNLSSTVSAQCPADVNGDGLQTPTDFNAWILAYNRRDPLADQNYDGEITPADFSAWLLNWNLGCDRFDAADLVLGGSVSPDLPAPFLRPVPARAPDGTDVGLHQPRFDGEVLRVPAPRLSRTFTNVGGGAAHLGAGYAESGEMVQFHAIRVQGGGFPRLQATHGLDVSGDPAGPTPANARRYALDLDSVAGATDWAAPPASGDVFKPQAGEYYRGAWLLVSEATRADASGVAISVGNYTPADGLSGDQGVGSQLTTVFCDLDMQTTSPQRVREWSTSRFVLRDENEIVFTIVDYAGGSSNESWAIMIRATRPDGQTPWSFQTPVVALERAGTNLVDHFHNFGLARNSTSGLVTAFISTGDVIGDQAVYVRSIADLSDAETNVADYSYAGQPMQLAFADEPSARWSGLSGWSEPVGASTWTPARNIFGQRVEDGGATDWGAPQYVACAPGPKRSQVLFGADISLGHAIVCYDVDTFDPLTASPYPEVWQRWGTASQFGFLGVPSGMNIFQLYTPTPEAPEWYAGNLSQTNFNGTFTPNTVIVGRATDDDRVVFSKAAQRVELQTFAMTDDGRTIFMGSGLGRSDPLTKLEFLRAPEVVRPRLIGAGFGQYQPLFAAGPTPLGTTFDAGADQGKNALLCELESRPGITARFATDADLAALEAAGLKLPGYGPVYYVETDGSETSPVYLSDTVSSTLPVCDSFQGPIGAPMHASLAEGMRTSELMFAVVNDPRRTPARAMPWRISFGDAGGSMPGADYRVVPIEGSDWFVGRLPYRGASMQGLRFRVTSTSGSGFTAAPGQVPVSFFLQVMGVSAGDDAMYPMGYAGPPNSEHSKAGGVVDAPLLLPDETQQITGLPTSGTVVYHGISDPHGVDVAYYEPTIAAGVEADHALFSIVDEGGNAIEVGFRNGITLYAKVWDGPGEPRFLDLFQSSYLQRQDDLKIAVRYEPASIEIDAWHNGNRTGRTLTFDLPTFASPSAWCGSADGGRSLPMQLLTVSAIDAVLSDVELQRVMETGEYAR